jgi:PhoPQ-activated pathogenicity-related protein
MHHHFRSLGGWTFAFKDYIDLNITGYVDDPRMQELAKIVDPYCKLVTHGILQLIFAYIFVAAYLDRLTMPKLLINSGGDEFFLPDDNHYFWNDLPGEKFLRLKH